MSSIVIGFPKSDHIELSVLGYERPPSGEFYDDNWLSCTVAIQAGAFRGKFSANFLTSELSSLYTDLQRLYRDLRGQVLFEPLESQLELKFSCNSLGHIVVSGTAMDQAGIGNKLSFSASFDQTHLGELLSSFGQLVQTYPVRT